MKKLLLISLITIVFFSCKKDVSGPALQGMDVTSVTWSFRAIQGYLQFTGFVPLSTGDSFKMNSNNTFSINYGDKACTGTYTWTSIDSATAIVNFKIQNWPSTDSGVLKTIMSSTDTCVSVKPPNLFYTPSLNGNYDFGALMELRFNNNSGDFILSYP